MSPPAAPTDTPHAGRLIATTLVAAVVTLAGYGLALSLASGEERTHLGVVIAAATVLAVPLVTALARLARGGAPLRWPLVVAAALLGQWLLPAAGTLSRLSDPLVSSFWRCGTGAATALLFSPVLAFGGALVAFAAARWAFPAVRARGALALRGLSLVTLAAVAALTVHAAVSVTTRPQARALLAAMPEAATLPEVTLAPAMPVRVDTAGTLLVWRRCDDNGCDLSLRQPAPARGESLHARTVRVGAEALRVRVDRGLDLAVFENLSGYAVGAFRLRSGEPTDVAWSDLRGRVAPPLPWFAAAAAGLLFALVAFARTGGDAKALRRWREARAATLSADGVVHVDGEAAAAQVQGVPSTPPGPVLVFDEAARAPFREASSVPANALRAGTHADLTDAIAVAETGRVALAAAVALWCALPLAFASLVVR